MLLTERQLTLQLSSVGYGGMCLVDTDYNIIGYQEYNKLWSRLVDHDRPRLDALAWRCIFGCLRIVERHVWAD